MLDGNQAYCHGLLSVTGIIVDNNKPDGTTPCDKLEVNNDNNDSD